VKFHTGCDGSVPNCIPVGAPTDEVTVEVIALVLGVTEDCPA